MNIYDMFSKIASGNCIGIDTLYPEKLLNMLQKEGVAVFDAVYKDGRLSLFIVNRELPAARRALHFFAADIEIEKVTGAQLLLTRLYRRRVFLAAAALLCLVIIWLSGSIWRIEICGARETDAEQIRSFLYDSGIRQSVRKNDIDTSMCEVRLLQTFSAFSEVKAEITGCRLIVTVVERTAPLTVYDMSVPVDLVAVSDCTVDEIDVFAGTAAVSAGDTVRAGDVIISGVVEYSYLDTAGRRLVHAMGRVLSIKTETYDDIIVEAYLPTESALQAEERKYYLFGRTFTVGGRESTEGCIKVCAVGRNAELLWFQLPVLYDETKWYNITNCEKKTDEAIAEEIQAAVAARVGSKATVRSLTYTLSAGDGYTLNALVTAVIAYNAVIERQIEQ